MQGLLYGKIHFDKTSENDPTFETTIAARKLMHRFREDQVQQLMDEVMSATRS